MTVGVETRTLQICVLLPATLCPHWHMCLNHLHIQASVLLININYNSIQQSVALCYDEPKQEVMGSFERCQLLWGAVNEKREM